MLFCLVITQKRKLKISSREEKEASGYYVINTPNFTKLYREISKHSMPRLTVSLPEWKSTKGQEHMQVYMCVCIYIYIYMCVCVCVCIYI